MNAYLGRYVLSLTLCGVHVARSPYELNVSAGQEDAEKLAEIRRESHDDDRLPTYGLLLAQVCAECCELVGLGEFGDRRAENLRARAGEVVHFALVARDAYSNVASGDGAAMPFAVRVRPPLSAAKAPSVTITDGGDGTVRIESMPHTVVILCQSMHADPWRRKSHGTSVSHSSRRRSPSL